MDMRGIEVFAANEIPLILDQRPPQRTRPSMILKLILGFLWRLIHFAINLFELWSHLIQNVQCYAISSGLLPKYRNLQLERLQYLAVVVDSREAKSTAKVKQLLSWLSAVGVKYVALYDPEGVLKELSKLCIEDPTNMSAGKSLDVDANAMTSLCHHKGMTIEFLSSSDGKEGIAKAAHLLCSSYLCNDDRSDPVFTEADMAKALKAVGYGGPEPDLLLVYGPVRCHLGFPAWRLRYTEIVHMGPLKSMKYGAIVKAFYDFSKKHQNYGK